MIDRDRENDVMACFVHHGTVTVCFMNSLFAALAEDTKRASEGERRRLVEYHDPGGPYIQDNRARAVRYFLEHTGYQWLWFLDNDVEFPPDTLYRLLEMAEEHELRILAGAYWNRYSGQECYLSWLNFDPDGVHALPYVPDTGGQPVEITACGMGCTLIHRDALQDVADMHQGDPWDTFGADIVLRLEDGGFLVAPSMDDFKPELLKGRRVIEQSRLGEDVTFCLRARQVGYPAYGHPHLVVEHFKPHFLEHGAPRNGHFDRSATPTGVISVEEDGTFAMRGEGSP